MLSRRNATFLFLGAGLSCALPAQDRCSSRADAALTKLAGLTLPVLAPAIALGGCVTSLLAPDTVAAGRGLSKRALNRWRESASQLLAGEFQHRQAAWAALAPKALRLSSVVDLRRQPVLVSCTAGDQVDAVLTGSWAKAFWEAQRQVLSRTPQWLVEGLTEYLRDAEAASAFDRGRLAAPGSAFPLPFGLEGASDMAGLLAVAQERGPKAVQDEIGRFNGVLDAPAGALQSRTMKAAQRALLDAWSASLQAHFPEDSSGQAGLAIALTLRGALRSQGGAFSGRGWGR